MDTGSVVSIISETVWKQNIEDSEIKTLDDGEDLPYLGYGTTELELEESTNCESHLCLFLVVPDTRYSMRTPAIIGTTIMQ